MNLSLQTHINYLVSLGFTVITVKDLSPYLVIAQKSTATLWIDESISAKELVESVFSNILAS